MWSCCTIYKYTIERHLFFVLSFSPLDLNTTITLDISSEVEVIITYDYRYKESKNAFDAKRLPGHPETSHEAQVGEDILLKADYKLLIPPQWEPSRLSSYRPVIMCQYQNLHLGQYHK